MPKQFQTCIHRATSLRPCLLKSTLSLVCKRCIKMVQEAQELCMSGVGCSTEELWGGKDIKAHICAHLIYNDFCDHEICQNKVSLIPAAYLPQPSALYVFCPSPCPSFVPSPPLPIRGDPNERAHFWLPSPASPPQSPSTSPTSLLDSLVSSRMYIDQGEILRVRVEADQFCHDEPGPQKFVERVGAEAKGRVRAPYNVIVSSFFWLFSVCAVV